MRASSGLCAVAVLAAAFAPAAAGSLPAAPRTTVESLNRAYQNERDARARYLVYSQKADEEGRPQIASLFRAIASAEDVHAGRIASALRKRGVDAHATSSSPEPGTTKENLETALRNETRERDSDYPAQAEAAKAAGDGDAAAVFRLAQAAEAMHAKLLQAVMANMDGWSSAEHSFSVCPSCGLIAEKLDFEVCPSCRLPRDQWMVIP